MERESSELGGRRPPESEPSDQALTSGEADPAATSTGSEPAFDFATHRRAAVDDYQAARRGYEDCAWAVHSVLKTALEVDRIRIHSLEARAKSIDSFGRKAASPSENDSSQPKYSAPLSEITDLSGVRVITFLLDTVEQVNEIIEREFEVLEKSTKSGLLEEGQRLGYQSVHYVVRFSPARCELPEYARFGNYVTEIQVRTILQHAWAEIEHDIQYKAVETIPSSIRRRFTSLAGLVEIADREFQAISDEDESARTDARRLVASGQLNCVEVTPDALKAYLDETYGPDGRMSDWSYNWTARLLKRLGFENLGDVHACVSPYDDDQVSRLLRGSRQGQLTRFEDVLLAALGETFIERHPWRREETDWFEQRARASLEKLAEAGIGTA